MFALFSNLKKYPNIVFGIGIVLKPWLSLPEIFPAIYISSCHKLYPIIYHTNWEIFFIFCEHNAFKQKLFLIYMFIVFMLVNLDKVTLCVFRIERQSKKKRIAVAMITLWEMWPEIHRSWELFWNTEHRFHCVPIQIWCGCPWFMSMSH